jgi:hypothetical protein
MPHIIAEKVQMFHYLCEGQYFAVVGRMTGEIYKGGDGNFIGNKDL